MGKVKTASSAKSAVAVPQDVQEKVNALKDEAGKLFISKDFAKACDSYDQAVKLLPAGAAEKVELLYKKTGCLLQQKKYKEAAKEASNVLELNPNYTNALKTRAKAYEAQGLLKQALSDVAAVNRTDGATTETKESEKRLRDATSGRSRPSSAAAPAASGAKASTSGNGFHLTVKATLGSESKLIYASLNLTYADLLEMVRAKFPAAGPVALKYLDKDGDLVTMASSRDLQTAFAEVAVAFQRQIAGLHAPKLLQQTGLPPLKVVVVPVASEADVPKPPPEEIAAMRAAAGAAQGQAQPGPHYEIEEWIVNFARTLTDVTGLDPSTHLELASSGNDAVQRAIQDTLHSEAAGPLLDSAAASFRDAAVAAVIQWGNVHILRADAGLQKLHKAGAKPWGKGAEFDAVMAEYDATQKKVEEALRLKPESWEAVGSLAQVEWERAKAVMGYVLQPLPSGTPEAEVQAALSSQLTGVLGGVSKEQVLGVKSYVDKCNSLFEKALEHAKAAQAEKEARDKAAGVPPKAEDPAAAAATPVANVLVMHGNILYDWSQVLAVTEAEAWRPVLDEAAAKFRASGAAEADIRSALKNHIKAKELDLGPDPEPEAPAAPAAPAAAPAAAAEDKKEKAPEAKGLPSLKVKKSKK